MRTIAEEGRGVIVLIRDLRPKSVSAWIAQNAESKSPRRKVDGRAPAGRDRHRLADPARRSGVSDMVLLTNAPPSRYVGLEAFGLRIVGQRRLS